jgi:hypothetical protein
MSRGEQELERPSQCGDEEYSSEGGDYLIGAQFCLNGTSSEVLCGSGVRPKSARKAAAHTVRIVREDGSQVRTNFVSV